MRNIFFSFLLLFSFVTKAQDTCTEDARTYINTNIVQNGVKAITATKLNIALNKILNSVDCNDSISQIGYIKTDSSTIVSYDVLNSLNTPPVSPTSGDVYLVGNLPTNEWSLHAKDIATWNGSAWTFVDAVQGNFLYNSTNALTYILRSGNWVQTAGIPALNNGNTISSGLKIGTNNLKSLTFETNNKSVSRFDSIGRFYVYDTALRKSNKFLQIDSSTGRLIASDILNSSSSSALFPNGFEFVSESRDLEASDAGKILVLQATSSDTPTVINIPYPSPLAENDNFAILVASEAEIQSNNGWVLNGGVDIVRTLVGESVLFTTISFGGNPYSTPFSSTETGFNSGDGKYKTPLRYLYDNLGFRGTATLSSGTVIVATDKIKTGYKIYVSVNTPSGTQGFLSAPTGSIVDATSFVINSTNAGDNSTVNWWIAP